MKTGSGRRPSRTVIFLGDSTSMTVGLEGEAYPFHLASLRRWEPDTVFVNCSQPGITSADAAAFFFREALVRHSPSAVVVYLGNCDANATELNKGVYSFWRHCAGGNRILFLSIVPSRG
ncbi:MAG: hypothetical protein WCI27_10180, partial [Candidatus Omnitrophota bacterium]